MAPASAGCILRETFAAKKPIAKRLGKACNNIPVVLCGCFPKTVISTSMIPKAIPHRIPKTMRFMPLPVDQYVLLKIASPDFALERPETVPEFFFQVKERVRPPSVVAQGSNRLDGLGRPQGKLVVEDKVISTGAGGKRRIDAALSDSATVVVHVGGVSTLPGGES